MFSSRTPGLSRLNKTQKASMAGVAAAGVAAVTFSLVPGTAVAAESQAPVQSPATSQVTTSATDSIETSAVSAIIAKQFSSPDTAAKVQSVVQKTASEKKAEEAAKKKAAAKAKADAEKRGEEAANRSTVRKPVYKNNLDGWIKESLAIMKKHKIPGSYEGLHRNIIRESSGNPKAINLWDINARNGIPSKGLLQVIPPTFKTYHVKGTPFDIYDPVANIVAAANYAADRYGSMDNVNSAY
ncbi:transglycosylase SLT domain-containing protein [Streptomyces sp. NPDC088147]|uniref:transglycosylase SLT domain-containing protein n=1 Tax=unclassified Streptomyces TaxID=2593676 RepID=UPI00101DB760|nr:transglycosylase SLT domain-containing protein [Streptomyces sp. L-9-10]RYJ27132.1 phage tail length tape-measure protein [Streptomyces sp. L-9-10]